MLRVTLVVTLGLAASSVLAQTDPRSLTGGPAPTPSAPHAGAPSQSTRVAGYVQVGETAPDFELDAAGGTRFQLRQMRGRWLALFFTDRRQSLPRLLADSDTLAALHFETVVVCNERAQTLTSWVAGRSLHMTAVADQGGEITALYGLWDADLEQTRPGLFLVDPQGVVRIAVFGRQIDPTALPGLVQSAQTGL
ncbi:MAG TPA: redoxin domain-containing protein [Candidatus Acidoferrales bacterium]|nr:redoxin domain-containing protein [Candidatus Acidoferrales bacterium]